MRAVALDDVIEQLAGRALMRYCSVRTKEYRSLVPIDKRIHNHLSHRH
jgi:hypothetical protein